MQVSHIWMIALTSFVDPHVQPDSVVYHFRTHGWLREWFYLPVVRKSPETILSAVTAAHVRTTAIELLSLKIILWSNKNDDDDNDGDGGRKQNTNKRQRQLTNDWNVNTTDFRKTNGTRYLCGTHRRAPVGRRNFLRSAAKTRENDNYRATAATRARAPVGQGLPSATVRDAIRLLSVVARKSFNALTTQ